MSSGFALLISQRTRRLSLVLTVFCIYFAHTFTRRQSLATVPFTAFFQRSSLRIREKKNHWIKCPRCCSEVTETLATIQFPLEPNLVCFDVDFENNTTRFSVISSLAPVFSFYLRMAQSFLDDVGAETKFRRKIIWRIEDNSTIEPTLVVRLKEAGFVVVAHSSKIYNTTAPQYSCWVPNYHFIEKKGFTEIISGLKASHVRFEERKPQIHWSGSTTGIPCDERIPCDNICKDIQRVRLLRKFKAARWLDLALTQVVQWCHGSRQFLHDEELLGDNVEEKKWAQFRGILDIDGNVDAWGLRWRLESGSVVFKVASSYEHFYSNMLVDGTHYISVNSDMSDLLEKTSMIQSQRPEDVQYLKKIAENARLLMTELTYFKLVSSVGSAISEGEISYP
jgi:hypothetical protein